MINDEEIWLKALQSRNNVAHAYNEDIALDIVRTAREDYLDYLKAFAGILVVIGHAFRELAFREKRTSLVNFDLPSGNVETRCGRAIGAGVFPVEQHADGLAMDSAFRQKSGGAAVRSFEPSARTALCTGAGSSDVAVDYQLGAAGSACENLSARRHGSTRRIDVPVDGNG